MENEDRKEIDSIFKLLDEGEKKLGKKENEPAAVLVFGPTGSGKSTFIQWITSENKNLISKETFSDSGEYLIEDTDDKIGSSTKSKTFFPEIMVDASTGTTFYDLPGFNDSRSSSHDIAASFFIKSVMDRVENGKILLVTSYHTVKKGMDRNGFPELLKNINDLMKNVEKYEKSIALVVTKVNNQKPDPIVIKGVENFLLEIIKDYEKDFERPDITEKERQFKTNAIKIVNILLSEENGEHSRITLFREPDQEGSLCEIELLTEGKKVIQRMITEKMLFARIDAKDFGYTISDSSKLEIDSLVTGVYDRISDCIGKIVEIIKDSLKRFVDPVRTKIGASNLEALTLIEAFAYSLQVDCFHEILTGAVYYFEHLDKIDGIAEALTTYLMALSIEVPESTVENLSNFSKYLEFFKLFRENIAPIPAKHWAHSFQLPLRYLIVSKQFIEDKACSLCENIISLILSDVDFIAEHVEKNFQLEITRMTEIIRSLPNISAPVKVNSLEAKKFYEKMTEGKHFLIELFENMKKFQTPQGLVRVISETLGSINVEAPSGILPKMFEKSREFEILDVMNPSNLAFPYNQCSNAFKTVVTYLQMQNLPTMVENTKEKIESEVSSSLKALAVAVRNTVEKKSLKLEIDEVGDEVKKWCSAFVPVHEALATETELGTFLSILASCLAESSLDERSVQHNLKLLKKQEKCLQFLKALQGEGKVFATQAWIDCINGLVECFDVELNFNDFAMALYENLIQYSVQMDVSRYNVSDLSDWGEPGCPQGIHVDETNFRLFVQKVEGFRIEAARKIINIIPSAQKISILNNILKVTLKNRIVCTYPTAPNSNVVLKANFIKFSDFLDSNGKFKGSEWENIQYLEIYALNTVFIDQDLNTLGERLELSIVAPKWEVIENRRIILDGRDGAILPKAANGTFPGGHGQNGAPGLPGMSGGAFFGTANTIVNSESLTISSHGGNGGIGQEAGNGANGQDGIAPPQLKIQQSAEVLREKFQKAYQTRGFEMENVDYARDLAAAAYIFRLLGTDGKNGGDAGLRGVGGRGGFFGKILLISLTSRCGTMKVGNDGRDGENGAAGVGGLGGRHGDRLIIRFHKDPKELWHDPAALFLRSKGMQHRTERFESRGLAKAGVTKNDFNSENLADPLPTAKIQNVDHVLRNFMIFFIDNASDRFVRFSTLETCVKFSTNPEIGNLRNTFGLIEDLKMLERFPRESSVNLKTFYAILLFNIENCALNLSANETAEIKKVLTYLYTVTLSRMSSLERHQDSDLVIDISRYLGTVSQNVTVLKSLQDESRLIATVDTLKNNFKTDMDKKIEEAQSLIEDTVTTEISKISSQFHVQISELVKETKELQKSNTNKIDLLHAKKTELENAMVVNTFLKVLGVISKVCVLLGPEGIAAGILVEAGTCVAATLQQGHPLRVPQKCEKELKQKLLDLSNSGITLIASIRTDVNKIQKVTKGIKNLERVLENLKNFEKKVHEKLVPMIEKMSNDLKKTANELETKSSIALDVIGWQVQGTLKETSLEIQKFTRGYKVHESVVRSVEKLEEVMKVLVKIYDRIQDYQEQQRLAVYMAQLSSASVQQISFSDPLLSNSFRELQIFVRSSILMNQYNSVLNAFKQWIFPFAEVFLQDFYLPQHLASNAIELEALASTASARIEEIRSKIVTYKTTIQNFDEHIYLAQFYANSTAMEPFYIWKNVEHREMITKLLAGESVLVKADIVNSLPGKDAIKFNFIELNFKSSDPSIQTEINAELLSFGVKMTHLGNSDFRYSDRYFSIPSASQTMHYAFEKSTNGNAVYGNNVYNKLISGDIMLSPFAMWKLKLTLDQTNSAKTFSSLSRFCDKVDLVLEGRGSYVITDATDYNVDKFYQVDDSIKLTNG